MLEAPCVVDPGAVVAWTSSPVTLEKTRNWGLKHGESNVSDYFMARLHWRRPQQGLKPNILH